MLRAEIFFIITTFIFAMAPRAVQAQNFLSFEQFQSLPTTYKIEYIGDLQQAVLKLGANPDLSGIVTAPTSSLHYLYTQLIQEAQAITLAERNEVCRLKSAKRLTKTQLFSSIEQIRNCSEISVNGSPQYFLPVVPERLVVLTGEVKSRIESGKLSRKERRVNEVIGTLEATISEFNKRGTRDRADYRAYIAKATQNLRSIHARSASKTVTKAASLAPVKPTGTTTRTVSSPNRALTPGSDTAATQVRPSASLAPVSYPASLGATSSQPANYQCLYAGFLIPKSSSGCQPYQKLPKKFVGDFFDSDQFLCSKSEEILCNPLIFGYEPNCGSEVETSCKAKKPLCITRSSSATKNCFELSQEKQTRPQVLKIWESPQGQKAYEDFINALLQLCDPQLLETRNLREAAQKDILQTCQVVFKVMEQNLKDKFLPKLGILQKLQNESRALSTD